MKPETKLIERIEPFMHNSYFWFNPTAGTYTRQLFDHKNAPAVVKNLMVECKFERLQVAGIGTAGDEPFAILAGPDAELEI